jgi:ubiquinone/menaquinone biosynthesis C-methylase UbiE
MHIDSAELTPSPGRYESDRRDTSMHHYLLQKEVEFVSRYLKGMTQQGILLDPCCGNGEISLVLDKRGLEILALDVNRLALAAFRQHSHDIPLVQGDALHLPFWNGGLDAIVAIHCFDHLDRVGFVEECSRVLRCGGMLIFDALNRSSYKQPLKRILYRASSGHQAGFFTKYVDVFSWKKVKHALAKSSFDVQAISGYGWIPFSVNSQSNLVNAAARIEQVLGLDRLAGVSPRILVAARKQVDCQD